MKENQIECPEYDSLVTEIAAAKQRVQDAARAAVAALFKRYFAAFPKVKAVGWTQYTPHFNDGDACVFRVGEPSISTKDADFSKVQDLYDEELFRETYTLKGDEKKAAAALPNFDDRIFEAAFGDHVLVIATPAGFHVIEYDHD